MQLAAIWLHEHYLLGTKIINLGGNYLYNFKLMNDSVEVSRKENKLFIPNFYSDEHISLITAIVGSNGAGKSTLLHTIRKVLKSNTGFGGFVNEYTNVLLIFEAKNDEIYTVIDYYGKNLAYDIRRRENIQYGGIECKFAGDVTLAKSKFVETIFYSPYLDLKNIYLDKSPDIDISLDSLIKNDNEQYPNRSNSTKLLGHRSQNVLRIINFQASEISKVLSEKLSLPTFDTIEVSIMIPDFNVGQFHNTPLNFRPLYEKLYAIWRKEINSTERRVTIDDEENIKILQLWFLHGYINTIFLAFEKTNHHIREGVLGFDLSLLDEMLLEEAVFYFTQNIDITNIGDFDQFSTKASDFLEQGLSIIEELTRKDITGTQSFRTNFEELTTLLKYETELLMYLQSTFGTPTSFLDLSFGDALSSGEKSFLDLFSRLFFALKKIDERQESYGHPNNRRELSHLIILLDEGDSGFHPTWKKKYVNILTQAIPEFFKALSISIQIIFTTHDALTLSDIPNHNIIYLKKDGKKIEVLESGDTARPTKSFGANISSLLNNSFFIEDGLVGEFAVAKIDKTIEWLRKEGRSTNEEREYHKKIIKMVDEPLIKQKLAEMYSKKTGEGLFQKQIIQKQINDLQDKLKNL